MRKPFIISIKKSDIGIGSQIHATVSGRADSLVLLTEKSDSAICDDANILDTTVRAAVVDDKNLKVPKILAEN